MNTLIYYFTLHGQSESSLISIGYVGIICTSSIQSPKEIVCDVLLRKKFPNDSFENENLTLEHITEATDSRLNLFSKEKDSEEITEFAFSDNDRSFQQCSFIKEVFNEREKAIKGIIDGEIAFEKSAYSVFAIRGYDINPATETGEQAGDYQPSTRSGD